MVGGVRHVIAPLVTEENSCVDTNSLKLQRIRAEEEEEQRRLAQLEYTRHVREMHSEVASRKRQRSEQAEEEESFERHFDEDVEEVIIDEGQEEPNKRIRTFDSHSDSSWFVEASPDTAKTPAVPIMYPWQKSFETLRELGVDENECFGCAFQTVAAHESIYANDWKALVEFFQASIKQCMNPRQLGIELYAFFDRTVMASLRANGDLAEGASLWSPHGILDHFLNHNRDPTVQMFLDYMAYTKMYNVIINNEIFEMHPESGRVMVNTDALKKLKLVWEMREKTMRTNPTQLPMASAPATGGKDGTVGFVHPFNQMKQRPNLADIRPRWGMR